MGRELVESGVVSGEVHRAAAVVLSDVLIREIGAELRRQIDAGTHRELVARAFGQQRRDELRRRRAGMVQVAATQLDLGVVLILGAEPEAVRIPVARRQRQVGRRRIGEIDHDVAEPAPHDVLVIAHHGPVVGRLVGEAEGGLRRHDDRRRDAAVGERPTARELRTEERVHRRAGGERADRGRQHEPGQDLGELRVAAVFDLLARDPVPADAQPVVDLENAAEIDRKAAARCGQRRVGEVGPGLHAELAERGARRQTGRNGERGRHDLRREIRALAQLQPARDVSDADAELEARADLIADRGLDIDRADVGVVAEEAPLESGDGPLRLEPVRGVKADAGGELLVDLVCEIGVRDGNDGVVEVGAGAGEVVGEAALRRDRGHADAEKLTAGIGLYAPYGLETKWPVAGFQGRFLGYNTDIRSIYIQPTIGYQISPSLKFGIGVAYITSRLKLRQRADLSTQVVPAALAVPAGLPAGTTFGQLGVETGTDFADASLSATGSGFAVNFGGILKVNNRLSIGGHWITRKQIKYSGDAKFTEILTGLVLPTAVGPLPAGTPVDALLSPEFTSGGPLSNGGVSTSIVMPPQATLGFAYKATDNWTVMGDYQYVVWGWFSDIVIDFANPTTPDLPLSPSNRDTHGFRFGTEYQYNTKVKLRGGYLHHSGASPAQFVTPLLPEGARNEFTVGAGIDLTPKLRADLAYQYIRQNDRRGTVNLAAGNTGLYQFSAHLFGIGAAFTF